MTPQRPPARPLSAEQQSLLITALRQAAALELALGDEEAAGRRLLALIAESQRARPSPMLGA